MFKNIQINLISLLQFVEKVSKDDKRNDYKDHLHQSAFNGMSNFRSEGEHTKFYYIHSVWFEEKIYPT